MPTAEIAGRRVHWIETGSGAPALLIHCALARAEAWREVARALHGRFRLRIVDLPGHGQSGDWTDDGDYHDVATREAAALIDARAHIVGHSFGATVALRLALDRPDRTQSLTLVEPVLFAAARDGPGWNVHHAAMAPVLEAWREGHREEAARGFLGIWGGSVPWGKMGEDQRAYVTRRIHLIPAQGPSLEEDSAGLLAPGRLEGLDLPTRVVTGDASPAVTDEIARTLTARLPRAETTVIEGGGHMAPLTHPQEVAEAIIRTAGPRP